MKNTSISKKQKPIKTNNEIGFHKDMNNSWYYYFSYWAIIFFLFYILEIIPFSPYLLYLAIVIFIVAELIYLIFFQIYYRIRQPTNPNIIRTKPAWYIIIGWLTLVLVLDIIPFFLIEPEINLESILFTIILILVYLLICQNNSIKMEEQYFTKGKKFNEASKKYKVHEYIF